MSIKQSLCWWTYANRGVDDDTLLRSAKAIGYKAVELLPSVEMLAKARDKGFAIASHGGHNGIEDGLNNPANHGRIEKEIVESLELAGKYDIANLIVFGGNRLEGVSDEQAADNAVIGLHRVAKAAEQAGVTLILELLNSRVDHKCYQADHTAWGVQVCEQVDSPRVKLLYDIYHMQIMEGDIIATIQKFHPYIAHYHTAGVPGRRDLDETQELNYPPIMRAIAATGYQGYIGQEFVPKADAITALEAAYRLCDI